MSEWISVKDRLPQHDGLTSKYVLTINVNGHIDCLDFYVDQWYKDSEHDFTNITHWMPLPEPPKNRTK